MNRSLKLSMLVALALGTSQALALDLGQIQVKSALGQPLLAEIPLHPDNPAELKNLTVQLASSEEFVRAGIAGGRTTIPLHFAVANVASGHPVIRITSSAAVDDPYLDLLIEVNGSAGKSVREFAILLDPPNTAAPTAEAAPARVATSHRPAPVKAAPARAPAPPTHAAANPKPAAATVSNGRYGPVERGQTLSGIARNTAPAGVDVKQMMLALQQANPDAFYRDNINALKSGAVLRVPTSAEAQAITIAAAVAEVRQQNSDWRAGTPGKPAIVANTATRAAGNSAPTPSASGDQLALVQARDGGAKTSGGNGTGKGDKSAAGIRQDLLRTQESVASLEQQSTELKSRLKDLADINDKNEHLLSLKDNEIAELQAKLAAARKAAGLPAAPATTSVPQTAAVTPPEGHLETATASTVAQAATASVAGSSAAAALATAIPANAASTPAGSASAPVVAAKPAPVKPAAKPVIRPTPAPVVEEPWYMQTWAWAAGAGGIVVLILLAMLGRRRKPGKTVAPKGSSSLADRFGSAPGAGQDFAGDDVDQEELLDQLAEHPDDIGLHLELVTLYYSRRDVEHFEAAAEAMHAHITDPEQDEWQDVLHMGEDLVPGHPLFDHHAELPMHEESEARREFDIDDYADDSDATSSMPPLPPTAPKRVSEYNFNFDLTKPTGVEAEDHPAAVEDVPVMAPPATDVHDTPSHVEPASTWNFDESDDAPLGTDQGHDLGEFNDDPIDTKLDLARAYLDMGDADGARAMLGEVMKEGSQMQQDVAKRLLENLP